MLKLFLSLCAAVVQESTDLSVSILFHMFDGDVLFPDDWVEIQCEADVQPSGFARLGQSPAGSIQNSALGNSPAGSIQNPASAKDSDSGFGSQGMQLGSEAGDTSSSLQHFVNPAPKKHPAPNPGLDPSVLQNQMIVGERFQLTQRLPWETGFAGKVLGYEDMFKLPFSKAPLRKQVLADEVKAQAAGTPHDLLIIRKSTVPKLAYTNVLVMVPHLVQGQSNYRPLLFQETVVYNFVLYLLKVGGSASSAKSFREALVFLRHLLDSPAADPSLSSTRIRLLHSLSPAEASPQAVGHTGLEAGSCA
jgi:hypothetical protein